MGKASLVLLSKRPRPGRVKTRLSPPLDSRQAASLYRAFLADQLRFARSIAPAGIETVVLLDAPWRPDGEMAARMEGTRIGLQGPGDLGQRLARALERVLAEGARCAIAIAVDAPTLPERTVLEALERLEDGVDAVVAPAADGGYVLIGIGRPLPELFARIPWGGADVLETTRARARGSSIRLVELEGWYDVDDARGLARLRAEMRLPTARRRAPETARVVRGLRWTGVS